MSVSIKLPRKVLKWAHINICSHRNKLVEISDVLITNMNVLAVTETHLDQTFSDDLVNINVIIFTGKIEMDMWRGCHTYSKSYFNKYKTIFNACRCRGSVATSTGAIC